MDLGTAIIVAATTWKCHVMLWRRGIIDVTCYQQCEVPNAWFRPCNRARTNDMCYFRSLWCYVRTVGPYSVHTYTASNDGTCGWIRRVPVPTFD
jgi:hypothetical protein